MEKRTKLELKGTEFPFYRTNRGQFDFENAGYSTNDMAEGKMSAMLAFIFFQSRDCAKRANITFPFTDLNDFVDNTTPDIIAVFSRLKEAEQAAVKNKTNKVPEGK
ncbi:hypothetical protein [uncultured Draconibacterium sp.]|uniref:hypothetical protein n=1 Tax=uncultured Draconibacterium sp. TaxID=1573823 RepID=UPI003216327B